MQYTGIVQICFEVEAEDFAMARRRILNLARGDRLRSGESSNGPELLSLMDENDKEEDEQV